LLGFEFPALIWPRSYSFVAGGRGFCVCECDGWLQRSNPGSCWVHCGRRTIAVNHRHHISFHTQSSVSLHGTFCFFISVFVGTEISAHALSGNRKRGARSSVQVDKEKQVSFSLFFSQMSPTIQSREGFTYAEYCCTAQSIIPKKP